MSEDDLKKLGIDALVDLMVKSTKELIDFNCEKTNLDMLKRKKKYS